MLKHNLLMMIRNIRRNKSSFMINLIGLSTGLACRILFYEQMATEFCIPDRFVHLVFFTSGICRPCDCFSISELAGD